MNWVQLRQFGAYRLLPAVIAVLLVGGVALGQPLKGSGTATIDGTMSPGEWTSAGQVSFDVNMPDGSTRSATLYVMNDETNLYLAVHVPGAFPVQLYSVNFLFDNNNDGIPQEGENALNVTQVFGSAAFGDMFRSFSFVGCAVERATTLCALEDGAGGGTEDGSGTVVNDGTATVFEISHPLNSLDPLDFALAPGQLVGFFVNVRFILTDTYYPGIDTYATMQIFGAAPPPAPLLATPADGSIDVELNPTLTWSASEGATSYQLQVSTDSDFSTTVVDASGLTETSYPVSGLGYLTTYYWRVNVRNDVGTGDWSETWSFTTIIPPPPAPVLASPVNGATGVDLNPTLAWNSAPTATSYGLQVSTTAGFTTTLVDQAGITTTSHQLSGLDFVTTYYWRVNASNSTGPGAWSETWSFTTRIQTIAELIVALRSEVEAYVANETLKPNDAKLMLRSLEDAVKRIAQGKTKQAIDEMEKFIKEVEKYVKRKTLTTAQGDALIADANAIIARLNSPTPLASNQSEQAQEPVPDEQSALEFSLAANYPNPFNPSTTITYEIQTPSDVTLKVFNMLGQEVSTLVDRYQSAGKYSVTFEANNLPSGLYVYQLQAGAKVATRTMVLVK